MLSRSNLRRAVLVLAAAVGAFVVLLLVQVQLVRIKPRLDDEQGNRPENLLVDGDDDGTTKTVVWLGDSTTTGVGADRFEGSMAYGLAAAEDGPVRLSVLGVSGHQVHEVLDEQLPDLVGINPDEIYIAVGANDVTALTRRPTFRARYNEMLDRVAEIAPDARVTILGVPDLGGASRFDWPLRGIAAWRGNGFDDDVQHIAAERGLVHVDFASLTGPTFRKDPDTYLAKDDFHPSDAGYALWVDTIIDVLRANGRDI